MLVNNAGIQRRGPLEDYPEETWRELMRANLDSVFFVGQAVARHMIARKRGRIINIGSVQSELARTNIAPYTASKGAVKMLTKGMATDWGKHGLRVNAIAPGYFAHRTQQGAGRGREVLRLARGPHADGPLGRRRRTRRRRDLPRLRRFEFRQWPHPLCRRRHHRLPLKASRSS